MRAAGTTGLVSMSGGSAGASETSLSSSPAGDGASVCAAAGLEARSASKMRRTRVTDGRMPSTVTGHGARFIFLITTLPPRLLRADRVVQSELQHAVHRLRFGHAQLGARADLFQPPAQRQVV